MEALLKKYFWVVKLGGVAMVVMFAASAGVHMLVSRLALEPAGDVIALDADEGDTEGEADEDEIKRKQAVMLDKMGGSTTPSKSAKERSADAVRLGNIFCSTCAPEPEPEELAHSSDALSGPVRPGEIKSRLPLMLVATMESDDPGYSMATILQTDTNALGSYSPADTLRAGVVIQRVERGRVVFRHGAQMEYIELGAEPPPAPAVAAVAIKPTKPKKNSQAIEGASEAISCDKNFTSCTVEKAFLERLLQNPAQLTKQARIVPAVRDGVTTGYKFYGIRPGSLPKLIGLKNGDLLTSVNGHKLDSMDQAMDLYNKLRRASHLSVTLERKGEQLQKEIDIK